jgi:cell division control protein 6
MSLLRKEDKIFKNRFVLSDNYIPEKLLSRDKEIGYIESLVEPVLSSTEPKSALITGLTGIGKSAVVKSVLNDLKDITDSMEDLNLRVVVVHVNCKLDNTETKAILSILNVLDPHHGLSMSGHPTNIYYEKFWEAVSKKRTALVVMFDEIHKMKNFDILYHLTRSSQFIVNPQDALIGLIGIANDLNWVEELDSSIMSSFGGTNFVFTPYDSEALIEILSARAALAFRPGVLDEMVIPLCAAYAAQEHGDARLALELLEEAGACAKGEGMDKVLEGHVKKANENLHNEGIYELVSTLPLHKKVILASIILLAKRNDKILTGDIEQKYISLCNHIDIDPLTRTSVSKNILKLEDAGLVMTKKMVEGVRGQPRRVTLRPGQIDKMKQALKVDYRFDRIDFGQAEEQTTLGGLGE